MHDLRLLNVLREVALRGSFSAAAESLAYTQPAISQQIARLEKHVGVKLIEREPRGVRLTPAGEVLVRHTERVMAQLAAADEELQEVAAQARGRLRIGSFATAAGTIVPRAVAAFRPLRPAIEVEISLLDPHESIPAVRRGDLEIAITEEGGFEGEVETDGLQIEHLLDDHMWVSLPADHPLATPLQYAAADHIHRVAGSGPIEGLGRGCSPVDNEWLVVGITNTDPADVTDLRVSPVQPAEDEPFLLGI